MKQAFRDYFTNSCPVMVLVDVSAFVYRAYHAMPALVRARDQKPVGAVRGFCSMVLKLLKEQVFDLSPAYFAMVADAKEKTFREREVFANYKSNRQTMPTDLQSQIPMIKDAICAFDMPFLEVAGYEADDLIATLANVAQQNSINVVIVGSDKDLMQLVAPTVFMYDPVKDKKIDEAAVFEKFGVAPTRIPDVQALTGDPVDNIPGIPGIGLKTASMLVQDFGSVEAIFLKASTIKSNRHKLLFQDAKNEQQANLAKKLATLEKSVPLTDALPSALEALAYQTPNIVKLKAYFASEDFVGLLPQLAFLDMKNLL